MIKNDNCLSFDKEQPSMHGHPHIPHDEQHSHSMEDMHNSAYCAQ
jgi:hypothetical protein